MLLTPRRNTSTYLDSPNEADIVAAINNVRVNKSTGADGIPPELLKAVPTLNAKILKSLVEEFWQNGTL